MHSSSELLEEPHVGIVQQADVGYRITQHRNAARPHAECPTRVFLRVDTNGVEHIRMNHARAENLHPSRVFARGTAGSVTQLALDVHLSRGLSEREEARPETCACFAEQLVREM